MKIKILHKFSSLMLAVLILLSTSSFAVQKHYCGDFLIDSSVFSSVEKCSKEPCSDTSNDQIVQPECCNDVVNIVEGQDAATYKFDDLDYEQQLFLVAFTGTYFHLFKDLSSQVIPHKNYTSPILITDIQVCNQVFLI
ncbi:hypothetical protein [Marixanthomonas sp. SCSIO 43207]|uniref:HYC_CC_PP family protein n=1 Tax=Marixanthomonas sp. SCSIO 43207 TaxID=2779360 RepID=UPI002106FF44|nr:hypothetical protein [Marixanthomonas sp. SCSIO 43207]